MRRKHLSVREAKAQFSAIADAASKGEEFIIHSHGKPKAKMSAVTPTPRPFKVDTQWLASMPLKSRSKRSEIVIRQERDGRD